MWRLVTSLPKKEQTIIILLDLLEGNAKAEQAVLDLTATELNNDERINTLFANSIYEMKSPYAVLTFKLLDGANISGDEH